VVQTWWPLAASWLLMSVELPATAAVVARLARPEINLAAYGGVVFPLALIIESPIIMLLAASTALSKDWASYAKLRRFMMGTSAGLTALHALVAFTPLYDFVVSRLIGAPAEVVEPARLGLMIMLPWTWAIAYRRFNQGVLIRFGRSRVVGQGTLVRLGANIAVLALGYLIGTIPGAAVAGGTATMGVVAEAVYIGWRVRPALRGQLRRAPAVEPALTFRALLDFYLPLAMTSLISLIANPIGSAALSRMPRALESLAVWPVIMGLLFIVRSLGIAYNEVVVALLDEPGSVASLRRFMILLSAGTTAFLLLFAATPLAAFWFERVSGLTPALAALARQGMWLALPLPALAALQSWYQGLILNSRRTRGITEAVVIFLLSSAAVYWGGVAWGRSAGLYVGLAGFTLSSLAQTAWLWQRSRACLRAAQARDDQHAAVPVSA
jgi:hypothetical protein